jgi:hypothetical protein
MNTRLEYGQSTISMRKDSQQEKLINSGIISEEEEDRQRTVCRRIRRITKNSDD